MGNKKSFIIHIDSLAVLDKLSDEQAGKLFKAIKDYHADILGELDLITEVAFVPFRNQFERDKNGYLNIIERNKANGIKGGRPEKPKKPSGLSGLSEKPKKTQENPKNLDSDNDSVSDSKNDNVNEKDIVERKKDFAHSLEIYLDKYGRDMLNAFYRYWSEESKHKTKPKMRMEMEKTWNLAGRLITWSEKEWNNKPSGKSDQIISAKAL